MAFRQINEGAPFQPINAAARLTGLSRGYLRHGCRSGEVPHVMVGREYRINIPALLEQLQAQSAAAMDGGKERV